jgi:hypothetical protein
MLARTKDIGCTNPLSYFIVKVFKLEFVCQMEKMADYCGKKDYIPIETDDTKHGKGRIN